MRKVTTRGLSSSRPGVWWTSVKDSIGMTGENASPAQRGSTAGLALPTPGLVGKTGPIRAMDRRGDTRGYPPVAMSGWDVIVTKGSCAGTTRKLPGSRGLASLGFVEDLCGGGLVKAPVWESEGESELNKAVEWKPEYRAENVVPPNHRPNMTFSSRGTRTSMAELVEQQYTKRKTKIIGTLGPACWDSDMMGKLLDAGLNIARFNFSHGTHEQHLEVLQRFRRVCKEKGMHAAVMLDTRGPEIRTAMLRGHEPILLDFGQEILIEAVGSKYDTWEGYKDAKETRIGISYIKLCQTVVPGDKILIADANLTILVSEVLSTTLLKGIVQHSVMLGERQNCILPTSSTRLPVLTNQDIQDLEFAVKHGVDYVAASFVESAADLAIIRRILDDAGGQDIKIIAKVATKRALRNVDELIEHADGILVARGNLGMEIRSEKVALAQKMIITKCNLAGKVVITARQMLESMISNPLPTRAEMTDVANAVFDGTDCVMLAAETAKGKFPAESVSTMAAIVENAELVNNYYAIFSFIRDFTPKPFSEMESIASSAARACIDCKAVLCIVVTKDGENARLVTKYRPHVPVVVVSSSYSVVQHASACFGQYGCLVDGIENIFGRKGPVFLGLEMAKQKGLIAEGGGEVVVVAESSTGIFFLSSFSSNTGA